MDNDFESMEWDYDDLNEYGLNESFADAMAEMDAVGE